MLRRVEVHSDDPDATRIVARALGDRLAEGPGGAIVLLTGPLGAGKTVFVQGLAAALGVSTPVKSPTFALEHRHNGRRALHHFDLYRLSAGNDLAELGLAELMAGPDVVAIEWPDRLDAVPEDAIHVSLDWPPGSDPGSDRRVILIEGPAARLDGLVIETGGVS
ncbi:MAG TPA: tRNA (adenosine(37)-N6)-threonylcarbamoyltransferase complex ATPase subunit type 1 TsaE [Candidatus Eisenbacteria bacterium]